MNDTNHFEVAGVIRRIEERATKNGGLWWLCFIESGKETVPIPVFRWPTGGPLQGGEGVRAIGSLSSSDQGYLRLKVDRIERVNVVVSDRDRGGGSTPPGGDAQVTCTTGNDSDDELPF